MGYTLSPKVQQKLIDHINIYRQVHVKNFSNARFIRKLIDAVILAQNTRLAFHSQDENYKRIASRIIIDDVDVAIKSTEDFSIKKNKIGYK